MDNQAKKTANDIVENNKWIRIFIVHPLGFKLPNIHGRVKTGEIINTVYLYMSEAKTKEYWITKGRYTDET